jgi:glycosyl hydrolase family 42 (putative beta-galactosidase)
MRTLSKSLLGLMLLFPLAARAQTSGVDLRGIYIYTNDVSQITKATSTALTASFNVPGVDGVAVVIGWDAIEPAMGQFQWTLLDQWIGLAVSLGKKIDLVVMAGGSMPSWLFQAAPTGAGAAPLSFTITPHGGQTNVCQSVTMAAPWAPAFLTQWDAMLAALAAHLRSAGTYGSITLVRLTGINRTTEEQRLPNQTPQSTGLACVTNAITTWQQAGYAPSKLEQGWTSILGSFAKSFPDKYFSLSLIPTAAAFPAISENGTIVSANVLPDLTQILIGAANQKFPGHLVVQFDFLMPGEAPSPDVIQAAQNFGTMAAFQTNEYLGGQGAACSEPVTNPTPCTDATFLTMLQTGIDPLGQANTLRAQYIEAFHDNVTAFPNATLQAHSALLSSSSFGLQDRGGNSLTSTGARPSISAGYAEIQPNTGGTTPSGVAIFGFRENNVLVSEVGVPAAPAVTSGRIYAEIAGTLDAGLAIANPNSGPAVINFYFTDAGGNAAGSGSTTITANRQIAQFLDQPPFNVYSGSTFQGTFTFTSSVPVAVVALRGFTNERGEFLMSTLPVIDITAAASTGTLVVPHFADGGGWTTQVLLVNPTDNSMIGSLQFLDGAGAPANVTIGAQTGSSFAYSVPKRTSQKLQTSGTAATTSAGSIRIIPTSGGAAPTPLVLFSNKPGGATVSQAGVPITSGTGFRVYVESAGVPGQIGNINSGIAVANTSSAAGSVTFDVTDLTGASISGIAPVTIPLASNGQTAKFLTDIFPSLRSPFKGVVRITTTSAGLSVVGLRTRINERGDFLITTTPPSNESSQTTTAPMFFPQVADGGGYTTEFILFSGTPGQTSAGILEFVTQSGLPFPLPLN